MVAYSPDYAREILMAIEACDFATADRLTLLMPDLNMTEEAAVTHVQWLCDLGYLEGNPITVAARFAPLEYTGLRLTGQGVWFLETFRDDGFYARTKQKAVELGCGMMPTALVKLAEAFLTGGG